jgi:hypothetical protein
MSLEDFAIRKEAATLASHVQWRHREATEQLLRCPLLLMVPMLALLTGFFATTSRCATQDEHLDLVDARAKLPQAAAYRDRHQAPGVYAVPDQAGNERHSMSANAKNPDFYSKNKRFVDGPARERSPHHGLHTPTTGDTGVEKARTLLAFRRYLANRG